MTGKNGNNENLKSKIFLIDTLTNANEVQRISNSQDILITFDIFSHKQFLKYKLEHLISDSFLNTADFEKINIKIYDFLDWHSQSNVSSYFQYDEINYAKLFQEQYTVFFASFLKKYFEIYKIFKKYPDTLFSASGILYDILSLFTSNVIKLSTKSNLDFAHDKIRINLKIGNKQSLIFIPRTFYLKLKSLSEFLINSFFSPPKNNSNQKSVLLVEFHTTRFKELLLNSRNSKSDFYFYARRRPSIWNYDSYQIMKKSKCRIITSKLLHNKTLDKEIDMGIKKIKSDFDQALSCDDFFSNFFLIDNISLWPILKKVFRNLIQSRISEIIYEIKLAKQLLQQHNFSSILILSETGLTEQIIVRLAKQFDIPVVLLQIGMHHDTKEAYLPNSSLGVYPIDSSYFAVWGDVTKLDAINNGNVDESKIHVVGSPRHDKISDENSPVSDYVLLATQGPRHNNPLGLTVEAFEKYEKAISQICKAVTKLNKKLIVKIHPGPDEYDVRAIVHSVDPSIQIITSGDILPLIPPCSLMIVTGQSTTIAEGLLLKKPVIVTGFTDYNYGIPQVVQSKGCIVSSLDDLPKLLEKIITDSSFKQEIISDGQKFISTYVKNFGKSSKTLLSFLDSI